jgi:hypothetical protein
VIVPFSPLTPEQLHVLQHSLGLDEHGQGTWYRNHYCSGPPCDSYATCRSLVELGLMVEHAPRALFGGDSCFVVTEAGKDAVRAQSPPAPKLTRGQRRYQQWFSSGASDVMSFGDWLKRGPIHA